TGPRRDLPAFPTRRSSDLDHEFVVDLQEHAGSEPTVEEIRVDPEQCDLHDVGGAALDGRVEGGALGVLAQDAVGAGEVGEGAARSEEHTSELQSRENLVCR